MPRIFIPAIPADTTFFEITGQEARYVLSVLRMRTGEELSLVDRDGAVHTARIRAASRNSVQVEITGAAKPLPEPSTGVVLLQGVLKGGKMDLVVQKTVELGVKEIVPLVTERTQVHETRKHGRWQKIALEAARQCGRTVVPRVHEPVDVEDFFGRLPKKIRGFIFWEEGGIPLSRECMPPPDEDTYAAVGPEGGFTGEEVGMAEEKGLVRSSLGPLILRAETAAISTVTLLQFLMGRMK